MNFVVFVASCSMLARISSILSILLAQPSVQPPLDWQLSAPAGFRSKLVLSETIFGISGAKSASSTSEVASGSSSLAKAAILSASASLSSVEEESLSEDDSCVFDSFVPNRFCAKCLPRSARAFHIVGEVPCSRYVAVSARYLQWFQRLPWTLAAPIPC